VTPVRALVCAGVVAACACPAPAAAAIAANGLTGPLYAAGSQEANYLTVVNLSSGKYEFHDFGVAVLPQGSCTNVFGTAGADCTQADSGDVLVMLGDRDDNFTSYLGGAIGAHADGGDGNDHLVGAEAGDLLSGGPGNDTTDAGFGDDVIDDRFATLGTGDPGSGDDTQIGNQGNDTIVAGPGADTIDGGAGIDTVDYSASAQPVA
jgi:Ca2+-binding RTX toxin-like protein